MTEYQVGQTVWIAEPHGWSATKAYPYTVERVTPSGQVALVSQSNPAVKQRLDARGNVMSGNQRWRSSKRVVTEAEAREFAREERLRALSYAIVTAAENLSKAARHEDAAEIEAKFSVVAKAIEARRAATIGAVEDESAARDSGFAQAKPYSETD